jgi:hypothetical protein
MFEYRRVLVRMRQGDSDRAIAKARLMGRRRAGELRQLAAARGWLDKGRGLPEDAVLAEVLGRAGGGLGGELLKALVHNHGYSGSYSAVRRFLQALDPRAPAATVILEFAPGGGRAGGLRRRPAAAR